MKTCHLSCIIGIFEEVQISKGIIFFLKYPRKGKIKTRLAKAYGDTFVLKLYECFIRDMLEKLESIDVECDVHLFLTPSDKITAMRRWLNKENKDYPIHPQEGKGLGQRMENAFKHMFQQHYEDCILVGSDFPDLPAAVLAEAFNSLRTSDAVIGPAADGGYYLLGFQRKKFCEAVFQGIKWSTDSVFRETKKTFKNEKLRVKILLQWWDVDNVQDLAAFFERNMYSDFSESRTMKFLITNQEELLKKVRDKNLQMSHQIP